MSYIKVCSLLLAVSLALVSVRAFAEDARRIKASTVVDSKREIRWDIIRGETHHFTQFADVDFVHRVASRLTPITLPLGSENVQVKMVVTDEAGNVKQKEVKCYAREHDKNAFGLRDELQRSVSFDSNVLHQFDTLPEGKSTIEFFLRGESILIDGAPAAEEWMIGPKVETLLKSLDVKQVSAVLEGDVYCILRGFKKKTAGAYKEEFVPMIDLVNESDEPIVISGYTNNRLPGQILHPFATETLRPEIGWQKPETFGICGVGWGDLTIGPGKTQRVDSYPVDVRGVRRFVISYRRTTEDGIVAGVAHSQPFIQTKDERRIWRVTPESPRAAEGSGAPP
jgi:hypothetical protein